MLTMDSSCFPAGFSYLFGFGMGVAAVVLSSWLVLLMRGAYYDEGGFRQRLANATPLWMPALTGVAALFVTTGWLARWVEICLPATSGDSPGVWVTGIGCALAIVAVGRLIRGRVRVGRMDGSTADGTKTDMQSSAEGAEGPQIRPSKLPKQCRRVVTEYALTYGVSVLIILTGVGLA